jgi:short-subunit dehydrogenase
MRAVIIGASAGLGRALAERMAAAGHTLFLVARDGRDLDAVARDLSLRFGGAVQWMEADLAQPDCDAIRKGALAALGSVDGLFMVSGIGDDQDHGHLDETVLQRLIAVNYAGPVALINAFLPDLTGPGPHHLVGIGSVASIRGRSRNVVYGSAKRGLEFYFESLRHRLSTSGCKVCFYRAGFMDTTMLGNGPRGLLVASPIDVAESIVADLDSGSDGMSYLPRWWRLIALILELLPWALFRRLRI